ncbi:MAG: hypothetical protein ABFE02_12305 [Sulfuricella sp.]
MKTIHGAYFWGAIKKYQEHLQAYADQNKIGVIDAALTLAKKLEAEGYGCSTPLLFAAAVELIESSGTTKGEVNHEHI